MKKTEMARRLTTMSSETVERIRDMIRLGYGAYGIRNEVSASLAQINAVFALARGQFE